MKFFERPSKPKTNIYAENELRVALRENHIRDQALQNRATHLDEKISDAFAKGALEAPQELDKIQAQIEQLRIKREGRK